MSLEVKTDQIRTEQAIQKLPLPGANPECFRIRPWNMPEDRYSGIRSPLLNHARKQREVIVLNQHHRILFTHNLFEHDICEFAIYRVVIFPILGAKRRPRMSDVA